MSAMQCTIYSKAEAFTTTRTEELRPGDEVLIYDGISCCHEWHIAADVVIAKSGRTRIRIIGANFYFDAGIVKAVRQYYYVAPARYRKPSGEEVPPHQTTYVNYQ